MFDELAQFNESGHFFFMPNDNLSITSNAPADKTGIFIINALVQGRVEMLYIGYSNWIAVNLGTLAIANNNLRDAINGCVIDNGGDWMRKMKELNIEALDIYWYTTDDGPSSEAPNIIARRLLQNYKKLHGRLPEWNTEIQEII